jgi:hypothetical protein
MTNMTFLGKGYKANNVLRLEHTDVCDPLVVQMRRGIE